VSLSLYIKGAILPLIMLLSWLDSSQGTGELHIGSGGWGERTSMVDEDERRIRDENLSEGMAIGAETLRAPAVNSQRL